jgi:hypothetical protein
MLVPGMGLEMVTGSQKIMLRYLNHVENVYNNILQYKFGLSALSGLHVYTIFGSNKSAVSYPYMQHTGSEFLLF